MGALKWFYLAASLTLAGAALAAEPAPRYNVVELQAEAQRELPNDTVTASLYVELNDANAAALAAAVNKAANEALRVAREYGSVRVRSGNNRLIRCTPRAMCCRAGALAPSFVLRARISKRHRA